MSAKYLGESFDLHGGGKDLVFPHHENEIAQSEAATGLTFARQWMHNGFITIDKEKMSKSLGNFFTIRDILEHFDGESLRLFLLGTHYRSPIDFSTEAIQAAESRTAYVYETLAKVDERLAREKAEPPPGPLHAQETVERLWPDFAAAMEDDFNTAAALGTLSDAFGIMNDLAGQPKGVDKPTVVRTLKRLRADLSKVAGVLGIWGQVPSEWLARHRLRAAKAKGIDPAWVEGRIAARAEARKAKDFAAADRIRDELAGKSVEIMDGAGGTTWRVLA